jgi:hypothetical protein
MSDFSIHDLFQLPWNADEILQAWITLERPDVDVEVTECVEDWLQSPDFNHVRRLFDSQFNDQIACLFSLYDRTIQSNSDSQQDGENVRWIEWRHAAEVLRAMTGSDQASLEDTFSDVSLLCEFVESTLRHIVSSTELDPEISEALDQLTHNQSTIPVPPTAGCSLVAVDYLLNHDLPIVAEHAEVIHSALGQWDDDALDAVIDQAENAGLEDECDVASLAEWRDSLSTLLQFFIQGWPVERARLKNQSQALFEFLLSWPTAASDFLFGRSEMMERLEQFIMPLEPNAGSSATPDDDSLPTPNDDPSRQVQLVPSRKMRDVGVWLADQTCTRSQRFLHDVRTIATTLGQSLGRDTPRIGKDIVNMLIGIDAVAARKESDGQTLHDLGDRLREILVADFGYKILSFDDLIGRSIHSVQGQAKLHNTIPVPNHTSDEIVGLHTPGYVFQYANGRVDVVKPAEVIVAE